MIVMLCDLARDDPLYAGSAGYASCSFQQVKNLGTIGGGALGFVETLIRVTLRGPWRVRSQERPGAAPIVDRCVVFCPLKEVDSKADRGPRHESGGFSSRAREGFPMAAPVSCSSAYCARRFQHRRSWSTAVTDPASQSQRRPDGFRETGPAAKSLAFRGGSEDVSAAAATVNRNWPGSTEVDREAGVGRRSGAWKIEEHQVIGIIMYLRTGSLLCELQATNMPGVRGLGNAFGGKEGRRNPPRTGVTTRWCNSAMR